MFAFDQNTFFILQQNPRWRRCTAARVKTNSEFTTNKLLQPKQETKVKLERKQEKTPRAVQE